MSNASQSLHVFVNTSLVGVDCVLFQSDSNVLMLNKHDEPRLRVFSFKSRILTNLEQKVSENQREKTASVFSIRIEYLFL